MKRFHTFIDRNFLIWKAVNSIDGSEEEDRFKLSEFGIKESILRGVPQWLRKWAVLICEYIQFEEQIYPSILKEDYANI